MAKKKIYIRPGHGKDDTGATAVDGKFEKDINLAVSLKVRDLLKNDFDIKMFREDDSKGTGVKQQLIDCCNEANDYKADLFLCIHHNASKSTGYEVIRKDTEGSLNVANAIAKEFEAIGQNKDSKGINLRPDLYEPAHCNMDMVLTEYCYIDDSEYDKVKDDTGQTKEANAIAKGVATSYGITLSQSTNHTSTASDGSIIITVIPNSKTNSNYENDDCKSDITNVETGSKPDIYDLATGIDKQYISEIESLLKIDPNIPQPFSKMWDKGFIMDWALDTLEDSKPDIKPNSYELIEGYNSQYYDSASKLKTLTKKYMIITAAPLYDEIRYILTEKNINDVLVYDINAKNFILFSEMICVGKAAKDKYSKIETKPIVGKTDEDTITLFKTWLDKTPHVKFTNQNDDGFIDTRDLNDKNEFLEYSTEDFEISGVGGDAGTAGDSGSGSELRNKIIAKAEEIIKTCQDGKARYDYPRGDRKPSDPSYIENGISYYDCSVYAEVCYTAAGIPMPAPSGSQYSKCSQPSGFVSSDMNRLKKEGKPGDLLFVGPGGCTHVGIYDGKGGHYAAHGHYGDSRDISHENSLPGFTSWGRCKELVEADKIADSGNFSNLKLTSGIGEAAFIKLIAPACQFYCKKYHLFASVMIACAVQESGHGTSPVAQADNNLFGVKTGGGINEFWKGAVGEHASDGGSYRHYDNVGQSIGDHARFLTVDDKGGFYKPIVNATTAQSQCYAYDSTPYAGDKSKGGQLASILNSDNLTQYDK